MEVETYEIEETTTEGKPPEEVEAVAIQMIEEMGLDGQKKLLAGPEDEVGTRIPYPIMKASEKAVYEQICTSKADLVDYSAGIIPLRVLQVAAHARDIFEGLEVWYPDIHDPDPILVGKRKPPGRTYGQEYFLLARWGEVLEPFEELAAKAEKLLKDDWKNRAETKLAEIKAFQASMDAQVKKYLGGTHVYTPF